MTLQQSTGDSYTVFLFDSVLARSLLLMGVYLCNMIINARHFGFRCFL